MLVLELVSPTDLCHCGCKLMLRLDYPMSSTLSAEHNPFRSRGKMVLTVFASLGLGNFTAAIVFVVLLGAFKGAISANVNHLEWVWRLLLGLGIIPAAATLYARLRMKESIPYEKCKLSTQKDIRDTNFLDVDPSSGSRGLRQQWVECKEYFSDAKHAKVLFATCMTWFLL